MRKLILTLLLPLMWTISFAQNKVEAEKLVDEGITFHDKGDYVTAIAKYDSALTLDKDNLYALVEKAYSYLAQKKYEETIKTAELAFAKHSTGSELKSLYVTYGNALDMVGRSFESVAAYERGIKQFPNEQMLYFNKAITLRGLKRSSDALVAIEKSIMLNPNHPGSHNAMSLILSDQGNVIGSLLACYRFFTLEPTGNRAAGVLGRTQELTKGGVTKDGDNTSKKGENTFETALLMLNTASSLDQGATYKNETDVQRFARKFNAICDALNASKKDNYGFLWDYYVPYLLELKAKGFSEIFANVAHASQQKPEISKYFQDNKAKLDEFATWSDNYKWKTN